MGHLVYNKRGKLMPWVALRDLSEKTTNEVTVKVEQDGHNEKYTIV
jgi:hypothetical protein